MHAVRIAVDPTDKPWILNREHQVCRRVGNRWQPLPGQFSEISIGGNGAVYALGMRGESDSNGSPIYNWTGASWQTVKGAATRIAVAPNGVPWMVSSSHGLYRLPDGDAWRQMPGRLVDIAFGADGSAWALGPPEDETADGFPLLRWHDRGWEKFPGHAKRIAVDEIGGPWIVNAKHEVFRLLEGFCWHEVPGMVTEIATGPNGSAWAIGRAKNNDPPPIVRWNGKRWISIDGERTDVVVPSLEANSGIPLLSAPVGDAQPVVYWRNGSDWRQMQGRVREITIEPDGSASLRLEDGERIPMAEGGELYMPDERTKGVKIQIQVNKSDEPPKDADHNQEANSA